MHDLRDRYSKEVELEFHGRTRWSDDDLSDAQNPSMIQVIPETRRAAGPPCLQNAGSCGLDRRDVTVGDGHKVAFMN